MKAILISEKRIEEVISELKAEDAMFYKAEGAFQGTFKDLDEVFEKYEVSQCGYVKFIARNELFFGWARCSGTYCFIGEYTGTVICDGTRHSLAEIFPIFGVDENTEVYFAESQSTAHPAIAGVLPDIKQPYDDIAKNYSGTRLYQQFEKAGLKIEIAKQFGY